ncbi:MAG: hypothetical protein J6Q30_00675 [Oscillospiraceae bacterium]|nr:hypothetical protein [Oscillospiraceae bacterium]
MTEAWTIILAAASAIVLLSNAAEKIIKAVKAAKAPEEKQNAEIEEIKSRLTKVEVMLSSDDQRIKDAKECNHVLTKGMLALLDHGINGNNVNQMKAARQDVEAYLINH